MKDLNEEELKIKFNNYMEQIKVPENLGGIIMEDFEKMKNEENQENVQNVEQRTNENAQNVINEGNVKKKKNHTALKISLGSVAAVVLVGTGIFVGTQLTGNKTVIFDNHSAQSGNMAGETKAIDEQKLELAIKDALINLAKKETSSLKTSANEYAEGHRILKSEVKDGKVYSYILARYGLYSLKDNKPSNISGSSMPITLIFKSSDSNKYELEELKQPKDGMEYASSLKEMFPEDLIESTKQLSNGIYENEFNNQIIEYLKNLKNITSNNESIKATETNNISISEAEKHQLQVFLNKLENNPWTLLTFENPKAVLTNTHNVGLDHNVDAAEILRYSIVHGDYVEGLVKDAPSPIYISTQDGMNKFFKEKLYGSNFTEEEIQKAFKDYYNKEVSGKYTFHVSDSSFTPAIIESAYKTSDNSYYIKLDRGQNIRLIKDSNDNYLFYSCTGFNGDVGGLIDMDITEEEKSELTTFLNKTENNPFTLLTFESPKNILTNTHNIGLSKNVDSAEILRYAIKLGGYGSGQDNVYGAEPGFVSTQEDMNRFFKEKLYGSKFTEEEIQKAFKNDYNKNVAGKYTFWVSDTCFTPVSIVSGKKTYDDRYTLKLSHGQNIMLIKDTDGKYKFYYCTGFDGKVGE